MTEDDFVDFCIRNKDLRIERSKEGDILIMPPTFGKTGKYNFRLAVQFGNWMNRDGTGEAYDSSTAFTLPNGAVRSPDLSWILTDRWNALSAAAQNKFPRICPDFLIELRSETDRLPVVKSKMEEYIENGAQLGWLIDPIDRRVYVYRQGQEVEILDDPQTVSGDPVLNGFVLDLAAVWD
ncbi:MAG: Uma2 family endonuclease [Pyrinomonadaceae bacterium]